jgi:hypothetical protein
MRETINTGQDIKTAYSGAQSALKENEQKLYSLIIRVSYVDLSGPTNLWERNSVPQACSEEPYDCIAFIACRVKAKYRGGVHKYSKTTNCSSQNGDMN